MTIECALLRFFEAFEGVSVSSAMASPEEPASGRRDSRFWLVLSVVFLSSFIAGFETKAIGTLLPTIAEDFDDGRSALSVWILPSFALVSPQPQRRR